MTQKPASRIVHINGWPGTGKLTVGRLLAVFDHAVRADPADSFVFTDALADDADDSATFSWYLDLAAGRGADLVAVLLDCAQEENARRLVSPGRSEALKLTDTARLQQLRANYKLLRGLAEHTVEIDKTDLSPEQTTARILAHIGV